MVTQFTFYMPKFMMKYIPGSIYYNTFLSNIADSVSTFMSFWFYKYMGGKATLATCFTIATLTSIPLIFINDTDPAFDTAWIPLIIFSMSFGVAAAVANLYVSHMDNFPVVFNTTTFAFCGSMGQFATVFAPLVAEVSHPVPQLSFTLMSAVAIFATLLIRPKTAQFY